MSPRPALPKTIVLLVLSVFVTVGSQVARAQADPATEPAVVAVRKVQPAVVNISTEKTVQKRQHDPASSFFNETFGGPVTPGLTVRQNVRSLGSGFFVDATGYIITNEHVVDRAADLKISVTTSAGKTYDAHYVTGSAESDLALLKVDAQETFPFLNIEDASPNYLGQSVLVLGNPLGYGNSVARGILSAKNRSVMVNTQEFKNLLQTDAAINPGNSGGPLVDLGGKLVGITSMKMAVNSQGIPAQGLNFAIPAETIRTKLAEFRQSTIRGAKPVLKPTEPAAKRNFGLHLEDLDGKHAEELGIKPNTAVFVSFVDVYSPAGDRGFQPGQVILRVGKFPVSSTHQIETLLEPVSTGSVVDFTVGTPQRIREGAVPSLQRQMLTLIAR